MKGWKVPVSDKVSGTRGETHTAESVMMADLMLTVLAAKDRILSTIATAVESYVPAIRYYKRAASETYV